MKHVSITTNYNLEQHQHKLQFDDNPVVIGYCRVSNGATVQNSIIAQMSSISGACERRFGTYNYNIIWVVEDHNDEPTGADHGTRGDGSDTSPSTDRESVRFALHLLRQGYGPYLACHRMDRLTRSFPFAVEIEGLVASLGGEVIVASPDIDCLPVSGWIFGGSALARGAL